MAVCPVVAVDIRVRTVKVQIASACITNRTTPVVAVATDIVK